jgi:hypothetical protein
MAFLREFSKGDWSAILEDDDSVGYAYLLHHGKVVSDVWLYNRGPAPEAAPWKTDAQMPFLNPAEYIAEGGTIQEPAPEALDVSWSGDDGPNLQVVVLMEDRPIAWLAPKSKPGWSALVRRSGPLARVRESRE